MYTKFAHIKSKQLIRSHLSISLGIPENVVQEAITSHHKKKQNYNYSNVFLILAISLLMLIYFFHNDYLSFSIFLFHWQTQADILYSRKMANPLKNTQKFYQKVQLKSVLLPYQNTMYMPLFLYMYYTLSNFHSQLLL